MGALSPMTLFIMLVARLSNNPNFHSLFVKFLFSVYLHQVVLLTAFFA
jgi:hypothetical protein